MGNTLSRPTEHDRMVAAEADLARLREENRGLREERTQVLELLKIVHPRNENEHKALIEARAALAQAEPDGDNYKGATTNCESCGTPHPYDAGCPDLAPAPPICLECGTSHPNELSCPAPAPPSAEEMLDFMQKHGYAVFCRDSHWLVTSDVWSIPIILDEDAAPSTIREAIQTKMEGGS